MPTALVTGCNKGIGYYIARGLCQKGFTVVMGCRDTAKASEAEAKLKTEIPEAILHHVRIDMENPSTFGDAASSVRENFGPAIDVLVNNAGIAYGSDSTVPFSSQADTTIAVNYRSTRQMCETFVPLIKKGGRIVNISSSLGSLNILKNDELKKRWLNAASADDIDILVDEFVTHAHTGDFKQLGWPESAYSVSKLALTTYTKELGKAHHDLHVFACCPGWCRTDLTVNRGMKSAEEGADTPLWLATSSECLASIPQGGIAMDRKCI